MNNAICQQDFFHEAVLGSMIIQTRYIIKKLLANIIYPDEQGFLKN
jgi:hypothetical protein